MVGGRWLSVVNVEDGEKAVGCGEKDEYGRTEDGISSSCMKLVCLACELLAVMSCIAPGDVICRLKRALLLLPAI